MLTLTHAERPRPISDLAAGLTEMALEILGKAGVRGDSVEMELEAWRVLTEELDHEMDLLRMRSAFEDPVHTGGVIEQALHRAVVRVAVHLDPERSLAEIEARVRPEVASLRVPADNRAALERLTPRPAAGRRPLGRSGVVRRLQLTPLN